MFVIVPKHSGPVAHIESGESGRGLARTQNACQGCKVRKAKCDGSKPCSRCRARDILCVYGKVDAAKLALSMTPERGIMLQEQNERLARAVRHMAARLSVLESRQSPPSDGNGRATDMLDEATDRAQHADITEILDQYAPEFPHAVGTQKSYESSHNGDGTFVPYRSKKRRVDNGGGEPCNERNNPSHMIVFKPLLQTQQVSNDELQTQQMSIDELPTGNMQHNPGQLHTDGTATAATSNLDTLDPHLQAYQTLLQMSQAHKTRATQLRGQADMAAALPDVANAACTMPASLGPNGQDASLYPPNEYLDNGATSLDAGFQDSLLDLVDWDMTLENCDPSTWNWTQNGQ